MPPRRLEHAVVAVDCHTCVPPPVRVQAGAPFSSLEAEVLD